MSAEAAAVRWRDVAARAGRNDLPGLLFEHLDMLAHHDLPEAVTEAWQMAEWPEEFAPRAAWLWAFDRATDDGQDAILVDEEVVQREASGDLAALTDETGCVTLYRGAIPARRDGMSWTNDRAMAEWFAHRFDGMAGDQGGRVWRITVPATYVLAILTGGRREAEVVVDTSEFDETEYEEVA